jgi:hypothetical protein
MEIVPWLMLSSAFRVFSVQGGLVSLAASTCSDLALFIAFILGARRMIELADGITALGQLTFAQQLKLAHRVLFPVLGLMIVCSVVVQSLGWRWVGLRMMLGFDGIAYDQVPFHGSLWSAILAAITLLLLIQVEMTGSTNIFTTLKELYRRLWFMGPAIVAVFIGDIVLTFMQGAVRQIVFAFWQSAWAPSLVRVLVFFTFVFTFASIRLWMTLAILVFGLRASYRRGGPAPTPNLPQT